VFLLKLKRLGNKQLNVGSKQLNVGFKQLNVGFKQLSVGNKQLNVGSKQLNVGFKQLSLGSKQLSLGSKQLSLDNKQLTYVILYSFLILPLAYNDQHCLQWRTCQTKSDVSAEIIILKNTALSRQPPAIEAM
jgi:X-X-X-Leu-X-X-Gly heptad repeat protein